MKSLHSISDYSTNKFLCSSDSMFRRALFTQIGNERSFIVHIPFASRLCCVVVFFFLLFFVFFIHFTTIRELLSNYHFFHCFVVVATENVSFVYNIYWKCFEKRNFSLTINSSSYASSSRSLVGFSLNLIAESSFMRTEYPFDGCAMSYWLRTYNIAQISLYGRYASILCVSGGNGLFVWGTSKPSIIVWPCTLRSARR